MKDCSETALAVALGSKYHQARHLIRWSPDETHSPVQVLAAVAPAEARPAEAADRAQSAGCYVEAAWHEGICKLCHARRLTGGEVVVSKLSCAPLAYALPKP